MGKKIQLKITENFLKKIKFLPTSLTKSARWKKRNWREFGYCNAEPEIEATLSEELNDVYKPFVFEEAPGGVKKNRL
jgi:2-oxoisovalerate dehydrogenase E1 component